MHHFLLCPALAFPWFITMTWEHNQTVHALNITQSESDSLRNWFDVFVGIYSNRHSPMIEAMIQQNLSFRPSFKLEKGKLTKNSLKSQKWNYMEDKVGWLFVIRRLVECNFIERHLVEIGGWVWLVRLSWVRQIVILWDVVDEMSQQIRLALKIEAKASEKERWGRNHQILHRWQRRIIFSAPSQSAKRHGPSSESYRMK